MILHGCSESDLLAAIQLACSNGDTRLFRNNVGVLQDRRGHYVRFGLCQGSSDLIGLKRVTITPDMVGRTLAVFVAIEAKAARGRVTDEQATFLEMLAGLHALAGVARSVDGAQRILTLSATYP